jgi:hypothetical protein
MTGRVRPASGIRSVLMTCGLIPLMPMTPATAATATIKSLGPIEAPEPPLNGDIERLCDGAPQSEKTEDFGRIDAPHAFGALPAMIAELMAPIEIPATQSGCRSASASAS